MSNFANPEELTTLYTTTFEWLVQNGEPEPAEGVEIPANPNIAPSTSWPAYYQIVLTGNELFGIAPQAAQRLGVDGRLGNLALYAQEMHHGLSQAGTLEFAPAHVSFIVREEGTARNTLYSITDPATSDVENMASTEYEFDELQQELEETKAEDPWDHFKIHFGLTNEHNLPGIEKQAFDALENVVAALKSHWPTILAARNSRQQG